MICNNSTIKPIVLTKYPIKFTAFLTKKASIIPVS